MQLSRRDIGDVTVIDVSDKLTLTDGSGTLKEKVTSAVFEGRKQIVLNLANLTYVDSAGLGEMVSCHSTATKGGAKVRLANTTGRLKDLLSVTKLVTVFDAYDTEAEAIASFAS